MLNLKWAKAVSVALVACAATCTIGSAVYADDVQDTKALKEQMRLMQQRLDEMQKQLETMSKRQAAPAAAPQQGPSVAKEKVEVAEPLFEKFAKGFYGTLDVSFDDVTKGIEKPVVASLAGDVEVEEAAEYLYQHGIPAYAYSTEIPVAVLGAKYQWARGAGLIPEV